eukprot:2017309-Heterocapsa_arctica.AAC.1
MRFSARSVHATKSWVLHLRPPHDRRVEGWGVSTGDGSPSSTSPPYHYGISLTSVGASPRCACRGQPAMWIVLITRVRRFGVQC